MRAERGGGLRLRTKLLLVVGTGLLTLAAVVVGSALIDLRRVDDLRDLEGRLVPKLELGPRVEAELSRLSQEMEDAVSAEDRAALAASAETKERLFALIGGSAEALTLAEVETLRLSLNGYYEVARRVSERMIEGETGEELVADIAKMQAQHARTLALFQETTRLDRTVLSSAFAAVRDEGQRANFFRLAMGLGGLALMIGLSLWVSRGVLRILGDLSRGFARFGAGDLAHRIPVTTDDELGAAAREANDMAARLHALAEQRDRADWLKEGQAGLGDELRGALEPAETARRALWFLSRRLRACAGALYVRTDDGALALASHYAKGAAGEKRSDEAGTGPVATFRVGEALVGQAAASDELLVVSDPPPDYLKIRSGLGEASPQAIVLLPLSHQGETVGVVELALLEPFSDDARQLLLSVTQMLVVSLEASRSRAALRVLLERTQRQAERLVAQEEELRLNNQELHAQQDGLRAANEELEAQRRALSGKNLELEEARRRVEEKADELTRVSTYKSQFLANMSHELRTPLNSMLLLSHLMAENEGKNLTPKQVEHCRTIHAAGEDLLTLINQVLDLAKIEAGRQDVYLESVDISTLEAHARRVFEPLASAKGIRLVVEVAAGAPSAIITDRERVQRILTNLLGNAVKFTEHGEVKLRIGRPEAGAVVQRSDLSVDTALALSVSDTGIGIPPDALEKIFAPFEQLEAHTKRRYAGTGLGLAIARESAGLIGGELQVVSAKGRGSTFVCYLPERATAAVAGPLRNVLAPISDDRGSLAEAEPHLLVIEDDAVLGEQLVDVIHARGFKALVATSAEEGLAAARERQPKGIILDVRLPDLDGWTVMQHLTQDPRTRSIPVHFISAVDAPERGLSLGAIGYLTKPASHAELASMVRALTPTPGRDASRVLVVEDSEREGHAIVALLEKERLDARHVGSAGEALAALSEGRYGCIVLDLGLPDMDGLGLLETLRQRAGVDMPRVVVHTGRSLTKKETRELEAYAQAVILKDGRSDERLLEEVRLFMRHIEAVRTPVSRPAAPIPGGAEASLSGVTLLVAEDDMRTVYALSALLRGKGAQVFVAETGREALDLLDANPGVQGVLMDVMMPEMDGYEAMRRLRQDPRHRTLPVIALTAKAMKGERERCLEAGATEYLSKPIDPERLLTTLATCLRRNEPDGI